LSNTPHQEACDIVWDRFEELASREGNLRVLELFREIDKDRDGTLDVKEFESALEAINIEDTDLKVIKKIMQTVTPNGKGQIEYKDLLHVLKGKADAKKANIAAEQKRQQRLRVNAMGTAGEKGAGGDGAGTGGAISGNGTGGRGERGDNGSGSGGAGGSGGRSGGRKGGNHRGGNTDYGKYDDGGTGGGAGGKGGSGGKGGGDEAADDEFPMYSKLFMEFIGTFFLCLTVALSAALSALAPLAIGGVLMCFVYAGAHVSGANYNPAVSFALGLRGVLPWKDAAMYMLVQLTASVAAGGVALLIMMTDIKAEDGKGMASIGHPAVNIENFSYMSAFFAEVFFTFALCFVVLNVATAKGNKGNQFFGMAVGFTVTAGACSGGPVSGGAFNPAVGFGLPLLAGAYKSILVYMLGPFTGAGLSAGMFYLTSLEVTRITFKQLHQIPHLYLRIV